MPSAKDVMLSVAQVCDLEPGDENNATWINPGLAGVVSDINERKTKAGKKFWPCMISDLTGPEEIEVSFFQRPPPFAVGDVINIFGSGLRRTEYNGKPQAALGKDTRVEVIGRSAHEQEQAQRRADCAPAVNGEPARIEGVTVGHAMNNAFTMLTRNAPADTVRAWIHQPEFWRDVKQVSSDAIRLARSMQAGHLAPATWAAADIPRAAWSEPQPEPAPSAGRADPPPVRGKPLAGPGGSVANDINEEVPF